MVLRGVDNVMLCDAYPPTMLKTRVQISSNLMPAALHFMPILPT